MNRAIPSRAIQMGKNVVRMTTAAGSGHPSSALSLVHVVAALMYNQMRYDPADPWHPGNDRLVLSEGHAVPVVYAAYADLGGVVGKSPEQRRALKLEDLLTLRELDSVLDGHPNPAEGFHFFGDPEEKPGEADPAAPDIQRLRGKEHILYGCRTVGVGEQQVTARLFP